MYLSRNLRGGGDVSEGLGAKNSVIFVNRGNN